MVQRQRLSSKRSAAGCAADWHQSVRLSLAGRALSWVQVSVRRGRATPPATAIQLLLRPGGPARSTRLEMVHSAAGRRTVAHIGTRVLAFRRTCCIRECAEAAQSQVGVRGQCRVARRANRSGERRSRGECDAMGSAHWTVRASRTSVQHSERWRANNARAMETRRTILQC